MNQWMMNTSSTKQGLEISCFLDDQLETPKKRKTVAKPGSDTSESPNMSSVSTPTKRSPETATDTSEINDSFFLNTWGSPRSSTPSSQVTSLSGTKINLETRFSSLSNTKSFYKTSSVPNNKILKPSDVSKRYTLSIPSVSTKHIDSPKQQASTVQREKPSKIQPKRPLIKIQKKKKSPAKFLKIVKVLADKSDEKTATTPPTDTNRKFFKSGGLTNKLTIMFGRHEVPLAPIRKASPNNERKGVANKRQRHDTSQEYSVFVPTEAESSLFYTNPTFSKRSPKQHKVGNLENKPKQQWPIKYRPDEASTKTTTGNLKKKSISPLNPIGKSRRNHFEKEQMMIDAGQRDVGPKLCNECGMLYAANDDEDVAIHFRMHNLFNSTLKFTGWKKERVVKEYDDGRVILIKPEDEYYAHKKVNDVMKLIDENLGFSQEAQPNRDRFTVYLFVSSKKIVGCLFAEHITEAFRIVLSGGGKPLCCSTESESACCGVNRIWTLASHRRCGVASRLLDCMLQSFSYGEILSPDKVAFSDPTPDGRSFATDYFKSPTFLVYKF